MKLDYELLLVDRHSNAHKSAEYLALNPTGRIPTLIDEGQPIFESSAMCIHLSEKHAEHKLMPALGSTERPLFFQWLAYLNNTLQAELMIRYYPHRHTTDEHAIASVVAAQDLRLAEIFAIINDALADKQYLLGDKISSCDFFLFMLAGWALPTQCSPLSFNHLARYLQRMSLHPTVQSVCATEGVDITAFESYA